MMYSRNPGECIYTPETALTETADRIAFQAHEATGAKYGRYPYIAHPRMVAERLKTEGYGQIPQAAGLLHDVIEDTPETYFSVMAKMMEGANDMDEPDVRSYAVDTLIVVQSLVNLTKIPGEHWRVKVARANRNSLSRIVKSKGDAQAHLDYNEWKVDEGIRKPRSVKSRVRRYMLTQEMLAEGQLNPQELEYIIGEQKKKLAWTEQS